MKFGARCRFKPATDVYSVKLSLLSSASFVSRSIETTGERRKFKLFVPERGRFVNFTEVDEEIDDDVDSANVAPAGCPIVVVCLCSVRSVPVRLVLVFIKIIHCFNKIEPSIFH